MSNYYEDVVDMVMTYYTGWDICRQLRLCPWFLNDPCAEPPAPEPPPPARARAFIPPAKLGSLVSFGTCRLNSAEPQANGAPFGSLPAAETPIGAAALAAQRQTMLSGAAQQQPGVAGAEAGQAAGVAQLAAQRALLHG